MAKLHVLTVKAVFPSGLLIVSNGKQDFPARVSIGKPVPAVGEAVKGAAGRSLQTVTLAMGRTQWKDSLPIGPVFYQL